MSTLVAEEIKCHHCAELCEEIIQFEDHSFCCVGCKAVYELITSAQLTQYYDTSELKPLKVEDNLSSARKFAFLEIPEVIEKLLKYDDEDMSVVRLYISGIHCSSCIYLLEHLPKLNDAIIKAEVNFVRKEVTISFRKASISLKEVALLLSQIGYPPAINLDSLDAPKKKIDPSGIGMKIAVAGFCFGNSMLISLPEYLDVGFQLEDSFKSLFGWINLGLSLPVMLYAAIDYFISSIKGLKHRYLNIDVPIALGISTLFIRSIIEILSQSGPGYMDSLTGLVFFLLIGKWYQGKSYQALAFDRDYTSYFPISVTRITSDAQEEVVMIKELNRGDRIILHSQELIPADGTIVKGKGKIDYSFVTGEAQPVARDISDKVYAGGRQMGGSLEIVLSQTVDNSELTQLWNSQENQGDQRPAYGGVIDKVSQYFTSVILLLALATFVYWHFVNPTIMWEATTAVLIVACPCALALAMPFGLGHGMRVFGSIGLYLKNALVIEQLSKVRSIIFDKTGTITTSQQQSIKFEGSELSREEQIIIKSVCANSAHPLSKLIASNIGTGLQKLPISTFEEQMGKGIRAEVNGLQVMIGSAEWVTNDSSKTNETEVYVSFDGDVKGKYLVGTTYRKGVFDLLHHLKERFTLTLLSGDNDGQRERLSQYFDQLRFNQKPQDKLHHIESEQEPSLMLGDGLNDAGALKAASVGVAVCEDVHQFSPACDALLQADSLSKLDGIIRFSRSVMRVVIVAFVISFAYNIVGLSFAITGHLTPVVSAILMPISSVTVVGFITLAIKFLSSRIFK
ncbi:MAG: heavy metal translocating P-type ATPase metal-binding domain-containing protein [Cyclobacteriaceae bacterium]